MENVYLPVQWDTTASQNILPNWSQPILPNWTVGLFNVNIGISTNPSVEAQTLQNVGSYGKQIGHLAEALEIVIAKLKLLDDKSLSLDQKDALTIFLNDVASVRQLKREHTQPDQSSCSAEKSKPTNATK